MKTRAFVAPAILTILQGCATWDAGSALYVVAVDAEKGECRALSEPRRSVCMDDLYRRMEAQEHFAEELARQRKSQEK